MAHRSTHPVESPKRSLQIIYASAKGAGANPLTNHADDLVSSVRTGVGIHTLTFRHSYPASVFPDIQVFGSTAGLRGKFTAWDARAKTATLRLEVGATATDAAAGDTVYMALHVRNTDRRD